MSHNEKRYRRQELVSPHFRFSSSRGFLLRFRSPLALSLFSVDSGPLTDNVVLSSVQRVLVLKRTAAFSVNGSSLLDSQRITALPSVQRYLGARSRAETSRDDLEQNHFRAGSLGQAPNRSILGQATSSNPQQLFPKRHSGVNLARISILSGKT